MNKKVVFYESMSGDRMNDNPYAIFEYLRSHPEYGDYLHVWSLGEHGIIPEQYEDSENVVFARRGSPSYAYFLASAGSIVCNATLPEYMMRRPEQRYLNTWHGVPYKSLGRDTARARFGPSAGIATFLKATHALTPCAFMTDALISAYSMAGASAVKIAEIGYPRVDQTVNATAEQRARVRQLVGIEETQPGASNSRPVVLYAPTWREDRENASVSTDTEQLMKDLAALGKLDIQLLYRGHHKIGRLLREESIGDQAGVIVPPQELSSNELLTVVDVLITDYSSIFFDFLPTGRPIVHYLYDLKEYEKSRGLNFSVDDLPGTVAKSTEEVVDAVHDAAAQISEIGTDVDIAHHPVQGESYRRAQLRFAPHEDGFAAKRAVEFFFNDQTHGFPVRSPRGTGPSVVFWGGTVSRTPADERFMRAVVESSRSRRYHTSLVVDRASEFNKTVVKEIKGNKKRIATLAYDQVPPILLASEQSRYEAFVALDSLDFAAVHSMLHDDPLLRRIFLREYRRRLGDTRFDKVFHAPGLTNHELALAVLAGPRKVLPNESVLGRLEIRLRKSMKRQKANLRNVRRFAGRGYRKIKRTLRRDR